MGHIWDVMKDYMSSNIYPSSTYTMWDPTFMPPKEQPKEYPIPNYMTFSFNLGVGSGMMLLMEMATGICLASDNVLGHQLMYDSLTHVPLKGDKYGPMMMALHTSCASLLFLIMYGHMGWIIYHHLFHYKSGTWMLGISSFVLMLISAFLGHLSLLGDMSHWSAKVILDMASMIPGVSDDFLSKTWGYYNAPYKLLRFFYWSHILLPFVILYLLGWHINFHYSSPTTESNHPSVSFTNEFGSKILFSKWYLILSDMFITVFGTLSYTVAWMEYEASLEKDKYSVYLKKIMVPEEWYFKMFFEMLRSAPNEELGALLLMSSIVVLFIFPFLTKPVKNPSKMFMLGHKFFSWLFFIDFWLLTWLGGQLEPYVLLSQVCISYYFLYFLVMMPLLNYYESWRSKNKKNNKNEKDKN